MKGIIVSQDRVVLCQNCGKTTTESFAFLEGLNAWICTECLIIQEAMAGLNCDPKHRDTPVEANEASELHPTRVFDSGATRDTNTNKLAYDKGLSVQVLQTYMEYLSKHRTMKDGSSRNWDNWKHGISVDTYRESLMRHTFDAVRKSHELPLREEAELNDLLAAIIFNASGWLFERLVTESKNREGV